MFYIYKGLVCTLYYISSYQDLLQILIAEKKIKFLKLTSQQPFCFDFYITMHIFSNIFEKVSIALGVFS